MTWPPGWQQAGSVPGTKLGLCCGQQLAFLALLPLGSVGQSCPWMLEPVRLCSYLPTPKALICATNVQAVPLGIHGQVPLIKPVRRGSSMRSKLSGARENRGAGVAFSEMKPGAGFQASQVWGRFPPHAAPPRPPWPSLIVRPQKSHLASLSRASIPPSRERVFSHSPSPGAEGGSCRPRPGPRQGSRTSGSRGDLHTLSPYVPELPWAKGEGGDGVMSSRPLHGAVWRSQAGPGACV